MISYTGKTLFFKIMDSNLKGMPVGKIVSWRIMGEVEVFTLQLFGQCYCILKAGSSVDLAGAAEGGAAGETSARQWRIGQLLFLFSLPLALPMRASLSQTMQMLGSL